MVHNEFIDIYRRNKSITILEEKKLHEENLLKKISQEIVQNINKEIRKIQTELQKKNQDLKRNFYII